MKILTRPIELLRCMRPVAAVFLLLVIVTSDNKIAAQHLFNHSSISSFEQLPDSSRLAAASLRVMMRHASVGVTIDGGLNCLQGTKNRCTSYVPYRFDRTRWVFQIRPNSGWYGKLLDFSTSMRSAIDSFDVFMFKYCYLDGLDQVAEPCGGSPIKPDRVEKAWNALVDTMRSLQTDFPSKRVVWLTVPLTQVGQQCTELMNARIREYCRSHDQWLIDLADIESYNAQLLHQVNAQGWEVAAKEFCGEKNEGAQACHPNDDGALRLAKVFWLCMADLSVTKSSVADVELERSSQRRLVPNPSSSFIQLVPTLDAESQYRIVDALGQEVMKGTCVDRVSVQGLNTGVYFLLVDQYHLAFMKD